MYIYDPQLASAQSLLKEESANSRLPTRKPSYSQRNISGFARHRGGSSSFVWTNEGLGEPAEKKSKASEADVRALRDSLNKWRFLKRESPITETGPIGPETKKAILQFQKDSGIKKPNGTADPATRERLTLLFEIQKIVPQGRFGPRFFVELVGLGGFRSMDEATQTEVLKRILTYGKARTLERISHLSNLVDYFGLSTIAAASRKLMLQILAGRPDDENLVSAFRSLIIYFFDVDEATQIWALKRLESYFGDRDRIGNLISVVGIIGRFSKESRKVILAAHAKYPSDTGLIDNFNRARFDPAFLSLDDPTQAKVLKRIVSYPRDIRNVDNLISVVTTPGFGNLGLEVQNQILSGLPARFGKIFLWQNPAGLTNMMTLVKALGFDKLYSEVRALMLDLQAARPINAKLAGALAGLALSPKMRDLKIAKQTIRQVNSSIP